MDLYTLKYFICIAENLSFSKAAKQLYVSQPSLSYKISNLENELNVKLFSRNNNKIELTDAGLYLLENAKSIVEKLDFITANLRNLSTENKNLLRLGVLELLLDMSFNDIISPYLKTASSCNFIVEKEGYKTLTKKFNDDNYYDFIITRDFLLPSKKIEPFLNHICISKDKLSIAVPDTHPLKALKSTYDLNAFSHDAFLSIAEPHSGNIYPTYFFPLLKERNYKGSQFLSASNIHELLVQVASGRGIALLPFSNKNLCHCQGIHFIDLEGDGVTANIVIAWKNNNKSITKEKFINYLTNTYSNI